MRSIILIASIAFVAVISQVSGDASEDLQKSLGITDAELKERLELVAKIEKLEIWGVLTVIQQERLRQAIVLDKKTPIAWNVLTTYDKIILPEHANFLWRLTHLEPHVRQLFMNALPTIPHEDTVAAATKKTWYKSLSEEEQKELSRLILTEKNIPEGLDSWKDAINDDEKVEEWISNNKDKLKPTEERAEKLDEIIGITEKERQEREELFSKVEKLEIWGVLTAVQQERLRQAIILDKEPPLIWTRLTTYDKIILPENANFLWRLVHWEPRTRNVFMNALPRVSHEDVLETATKKTWFKSLSEGEQKKLSVLILVEKNVPEGQDSWKAAVNDAKTGEWVQTNKSTLLA